MENTRNQELTGGKELLAVSFGTTHAGTRRSTIGAVEDTLQEAFPGWQVRRAFTSGMILRILQKRDGLSVDSVEEALERAVRGGVKELVIQPTHLMRGIEYKRMLEAVEACRDRIEKIVVAAPLLETKQDLEEAVAAVHAELAPYAGKDMSVLFMGHGTDDEANEVYARLQQVMDGQGRTGSWIATVEGTPTLDEVLPRLLETGCKRAVLMPFMVVAGTHAAEDMAGEEETSWKNRLEAAGIQAIPVLKGLGEIGAVRQIYVRHTAEAVAALQEKAVFAAAVTDTRP